MKIYIFSLVLAFFVLSFDVLAGDFYENRIIVKFKQNSTLHNKWNSNGRIGEIDEFKWILGDNTSQPYINQNLLEAHRKSAPHNILAKTSGNKQSGLDRIAVIHYSSNISPIYAAAKISGISSIEYAEPQAVVRLNYEKLNDPMFKNQYYYNTVRAGAAWQIREELDTVLIAIVDTGIDYEHTDLKDNIFKNAGEIGTDENGNDKRFNGIDDDGNGYVDDWIGWDFSGHGDNDPLPGNLHGTHVAGICGAIGNNNVGIAGIAPNVKLMSVKIGYDDPNSTAVVNSMQGVLYAATMGADIINCSWGGASYSHADAEIIAEAVKLGSIIVAAAGNDGRNIPNYPAAYKDVLSVAATDTSDIATFFTNFHHSVDVSAPGHQIISTVPGDSYTVLNGTSMAAPIVSAAAAIIKGKYPEMNRMQVVEIIKASADTIDHLNIGYENLLGRGRINIEKALNAENLIAVVIDSIRIVEEFEDKLLLPGEFFNIDFSLINALANAENVSVILSVDDNDFVEIFKDSIYFGNMQQMQIIRPNELFRLQLTPNIPIDYTFQIKLEAFAGDRLLTSEIIEIVANPSYQTMSGNKIKVTFNNSGNIAFNDYPNNKQGVGFTFDNSKSLLFEGALMISTDDKTLFNVARTTRQLVQDSSFRSAQSFNIEKPGRISDEDGYVEFKAYYDNGSYAGIDIKQNVYQFDESGLDNVAFLVYTIKNTSNKHYDSVYTGIFMDWDINIPSRNRAWWDYENMMGIVRNVDYDSYPIAAAVLLSQWNENFFAIDNNGASFENPGIYDGFTKSEKLRTLTSGIGRDKSSITDVSMVISAGPFRLSPNDSAVVAFALIGAYDMESIVNSAENARMKSSQLAFGIAPMKKSTKNIVSSVYPNPTSEIINILLYINSPTEYNIGLYDVSGKLIKKLAVDYHFNAGKQFLSYNLKGLPDGAYFILFENNDEKMTYPFIFHK